MKILLVDDHPLFAEGLKNLLLARNLEVVGLARDGLEALAAARAARPDVILMDIVMPRCSGLEATCLIKAEMPEVKIVMLTSAEDDENLFEAIKCGASGYLLKSLQAGELFELLAGLQRGEVPFAPGLAAKVLREFARQTRDAEHGSDSAGGAEAKEDRLAPRQREVLTLVAQGLTYKEVGAALGLSERTVKYHMERILDLLHLENRAHAITYAERLGLTLKKEKSSSS